MRRGFGHLALASGMDLCSGVRRGFGQGFVFRDLLWLLAYFGFEHFVWTLGRVFPVQECSYRMGNGKSVRRAGKDVKCFHTRREPMRML